MNYQDDKLSRKRMAAKEQLRRDVLHAKMILAGTGIMIICLVIYLVLSVIKGSADDENLGVTDNGSDDVGTYQSESDDSSFEDSSSEQALAVGDAIEVPNEYVIENFPIILQMPELPTGCEITALTMAINYYGFDVDKVTMATDYLPCEELNLYYSEDGTLYGNDLNNVFVGDPASSHGYVCGTGAIVTAANDYFSDLGVLMSASDKSGIEVEDLYYYVSCDTPVVVWVTIGMEDRYTPEGWYTTDGEYVDWSSNDHGAVLIGYSENTVTIADPLAGIVEYSREQFESVYEQRGCHCVVLE